MAGRTAIRVLLSVLILLSSSAFYASFVTVGPSQAATDIERESRTSIDEQGLVAPQRDGITVVSSQGFRKKPAALIAYSRSGRVLYSNTTYDEYFDVDPHTAGKTTVLYVAVKSLSKNECDATVPCRLNVVERVNLSTGETERIFSRIEAGDKNKYHDVDLVGEQRLLIANILENRVQIVNLSTGLTEWEWAAEQDFTPASGGPYPDDWTHLNDVELPSRDVQGTETRLKQSIKQTFPPKVVNALRFILPGWASIPTCSCWR